MTTRRTNRRPRRTLTVEHLEARTVLSASWGELQATFNQGTEFLQQQVAPLVEDTFGLDLPLLAQSVADSFGLTDKVQSGFHISLGATVADARQALESAGFTVERLELEPDAQTGDYLRITKTFQWDGEQAAFEIGGATGFDYFDDGVNGRLAGNLAATAPDVDLVLTLGIDMLDGVPTFYIDESSHFSVNGVSASGQVQGDLSIRWLADVHVTGSADLTASGSLGFHDVDDDGKVRMPDLALGNTIVGDFTGDIHLHGDFTARLPLLDDISWAANFPAHFSGGSVTIDFDPERDLVAPSVDDVFLKLGKGLFSATDGFNPLGGIGGLLNEKLPIIDTSLGEQLGISLKLGWLVSGVSDVRNDVAGLSNQLRSFGVSIPLLDNPGLITNLIQGDRVDLLTFNTGDRVEWSAYTNVPLAVVPLPSPIPLAVTVSLEIDPHAYFEYYVGVGVDTTGFYIDPATHVGVGAGIRGGINAEVSLAGIASVEIGMGAGFSVSGGVGLIDPDPSDGKIYLDEIFRDGRSLADSFLDVMDFRLTAEATAYAKVEASVLFFSFTIYEGSWSLGQIWSSDHAASVPNTPEGTYRVRDLGAATTPLSLPVLADGTLVIDGTPQQDSVYLTQQDGAVEVNWAGKGKNTFPGVTRVRFRGNEGDDQLRVAPGFSLPIDADGGAGNDVLEGGQADDILRGGDDADRIFGRNGNDQLFGDSGTDELDGGAGNDFLSGGIGDDYLKGGLDDDLLEGGADNDHLEGGSGIDRLYGNEGADLLHGGSGDDLLDGGSEADQLFGDENNDLLLGQGGDDFLSGGADDDTLQGGVGKDVLLGDAGADELHGQDNDDTLQGGAGNDLLEGGAGDDLLGGDDGDDRLWGDDIPDAQGSTHLEGDDDLHGGEGEDILHGGGGADRLNGNAGADELYGEAGDDLLALDFGGVQETTTDVLSGGLDRDWITVVGTDLDDNIELQQTGEGTFVAWQRDQAGAVLGQFHFSLLRAADGSLLDSDIEQVGIDGGAGNDVLTVGPSVVFDVTLWGGEGNDVLTGGAGYDRLEGGPGNDTLRGGSGNDDLFGGTGNDRLEGGTGSDRMQGGTGNDVLEGGGGRDIMHGGEGDDTIRAGSGLEGVMAYGDAGDDWLYGADGIDQLDGGADRDHLFGGAMGDYLTGGGGDDILDGQSGRDMLRGGEGNDGLYAGDSQGLPDGVDWIAVYQGLLTREIDLIGSPLLSITGQIEELESRIAQIESKLAAVEERLDLLDEPDERRPLEAYRASLEEDRQILVEASASLQNELVWINATQTDLLPRQTVAIDMLSGEGGRDTLYGSDVADFLSGDGDDDVIYHSAGADIVSGGQGEDAYRVVGTNGNDTIAITAVERATNGSLLPAVTIDGVEAARLEEIDIEIISVDARGGADRVTVRFGNQAVRDVEIAGGDGDDRIKLEGLKAKATVYGGLGDDIIYGGDNDDVIYGQKGNDWINGGEGNDVINVWGDGIWGEEGSEDVFSPTVFGGNGHDRIIGSRNKDVIYGEDGNDTIFSEDGNDVVYGGPDNDYISISSGEQYVDAGEGNDFIDDRPESGGRYDTILGGSGNDTLQTTPYSLDTRSGLEIVTVPGTKKALLTPDGALHVLFNDRYVFTRGQWSHKGNIGVGGGDTEDIAVNAQGELFLRTIGSARALYKLTPAMDRAYEVAQNVRDFKLSRDGALHILFRDGFVLTRGQWSHKGNTGVGGGDSIKIEVNDRGELFILTNSSQKHLYKLTPAMDQAYVVDVGIEDFELDRYGEANITRRAW